MALLNWRALRLCGEGRRVVVDRPDCAGDELGDRAGGLAIRAA